MLKKLSGGFKEPGTTPAFDPASLDDPLALKTDWCHQNSGASFKTHSLEQPHDQRFEFRSTMGALLFLLFFLVTGVLVLLALIHTTFNHPEDSFGIAHWLMLAIGTLFTVCGAGTLLYTTTPIVFDLRNGYFCRSRKNPQHMVEPARIKGYTRLDRVHALQLISYYDTSGDSSHYVYELSLVLDDASRVHVVSHGCQTSMRDDARTLCQWLGKPLWDAT